MLEWLNIFIHAIEIIFLICNSSSMQNFNFHLHDSSLKWFSIRREIFMTEEVFSVLSMNLRKWAMLQPSFPFMFSICVLVSYLVSRKIHILDAVCSVACWLLSAFVPVQMRGKIESNFLRGVFFCLGWRPIGFSICLSWSHVQRLKSRLMQAEVLHCLIKVSALFSFTVECFWQTSSQSNVDLVFSRFCRCGILSTVLI